MPKITISRAISLIEGNFDTREVSRFLYKRIRNKPTTVKVLLKDGTIHRLRYSTKWNAFQWVKEKEEIRREFSTL